MKKIWVIALFLFLLPFPAHADSTINISDISHRQINGKFFNDDLATSISPEGELGKLVYTPPSGKRIWKIDAALIDDIQLMAEGYKLIDGTDGNGKDLAKQWLAQLKIISQYDNIYALPYGDPSGYWIHKLAPHSESYFLAVGGDRLSKFFGKNIAPPQSYSNYSYFKLAPFQKTAFTDASDAFQAASKYMDPIESETLILKSAAIFNRSLSGHQRNLLTKDLVEHTDEILHKIHLSPGRFTISANKQELPITVTNNFPNPANLKLLISDLNSRITTPEVIKLKIEGKSRAQIKIPVKVLASGDSAIAVGIANEQNQKLGDYVIYPITIRVISPIATGITYAAAIVLFISALVQSFRRIRRRER